MTIIKLAVTDITVLFHKLSEVEVGLSLLPPVIPDSLEGMCDSQQR